MKVKIRAFGIAREILNGGAHEFIVENEVAVGDVRSLLIETYPEFDKLASLRFAVNTDYVTDEFILSEGDEVVIIPPVSGG